MKKITLLALILNPVICFLSAKQAMAQIDFGSSTATARGGAVTATAMNYEAIEINPANLGWKENHKVSFTIMNFGLNIQAKVATVHDFEHVRFDSLPLNEKQEMYAAATAPGGFNLSASFTWAAVSCSFPKIGGFALSLTDEAYAHVFINATAADVLFNGVNSQTYKDTANITSQSVAQEFNGCNAGGYYYRELNIDYGRRIWAVRINLPEKGGAFFGSPERITSKNSISDTAYNFLQVFGGVGFKPVWGLADYNGVISGGQNIENGTYVFDSSYFHNILSNIFTANGRGYGIDLGLSAIFRNCKFGISVIDLGKIDWQNNSFLKTTIVMPSLSSLDGAGGIYQNSVDNFKIFGHYVTRVPNAGPNYTTDLPSKFRTGLSYMLNRFISFSTDFVAPLNNVQGNIINPYWVISSQVNVYNYVNLNLGFATEKGFGSVVPLGIFFDCFKGPELYAGTNDILAYLGGGSGHVFSVAFGLRLFAL